MKSVPEDYYRRLRAIDADHWWRLGMQEITVALLGPRLRASGGSVLDAGCGTGGFLAWLAGLGAFDRLAGVDLSPEAIELARASVPRAELHVTGLAELPFGDGEFDLITLNDVLQHVHEQAVLPCLVELRRVLAPTGALLVRTNGGRHARRERSDWRLYDPPALARDLGQAGFRIERLTYANSLLSLPASARGRAPSAPTAETCGIPRPAGRVATRIGQAVLRLEARYLRRPGRRLPFGHTLFAVAVDAGLDARRTGGG